MVYLIYGTSYNQINDEIKNIFKDLSDVEIIEYHKTNMEELIINFSYTSLFNDNRKIIVNNFDIFNDKNEKDLELFEKYLNEPNINNTIIFTTFEKVDERKKIVKIIKDKYKFINIKPIMYKDLIDKIIQICKSKKYKISYDDARYIANSSLNNYDIVLLELNKVFLYYKEPQEIIKNDIEKFISITMDDNNFKFVDAVINNDYDLAMRLLRDFKIQKIEPLLLISLLAREYRFMLMIKNREEDELKSFNLQSWQIDKINKESYSYNKEDIENKIIGLAELDYKIKNNEIDKYLGLELFILK